MFEVIYDSQELEYKRPFGAIPINADVEFKIKANHKCKAKMIFNSSLGKEEYDLECLRQDRDYFIYYLKLNTSKYIGPIFYYFKFQVEDKIYYYSNNEELQGGIGKLSSIKPKGHYHFYVYDLKYKVPEWFKTGITYHIFVDRFNNDSSTLETVDKELWKVYGGNLKGIINKLDYLKDLGVSIIYLSPIFESESHHKYDVEDYKKITSDFGDLETFKELVSEMKKRDMHLILDGVFNHSGSNSKYFNKYSKYETIGAYQSKESPYFDWYTFNSFPDDYQCWNGIDTLPEHKQDNEDFLYYLLFNQDSIVNYWMNLGVEGWRLDAADLLTDDFLRKVYAVAKKNNPNSVIIGELWNDGTNFRYHTENEIHEYMCGCELESVTNYPLHGLILQYSNGEYDSARFIKGFYSLLENYPIEYFYSLLNFLGTHDIERVYHLLEGNVDYLKLAILLSLSLPGVPLIYYGDEAGLDGAGDPDNRRPFPWTNINSEIYNHYRSMCHMRNNNDAFKRGSIYFVENSDFLIFKRSYENENIYVILNNSTEKELNLSILSNDDIKLKNLENNEVYDIKDKLSFDGFSYKILLEQI